MSYYKITIEIYDTKDETIWEYISKLPPGAKYIGLQKDGQRYSQSKQDLEKHNGYIKDLELREARSRIELAKHLLEKNKKELEELEKQCQ